MTPDAAAHLVGAFLLTAGLPAQLRGQAVLSRLLLLAGMAVAHIPDLVANTARCASGCCQ
jgi:hypothetical protein